MQLPEHSVLGASGASRWMVCPGSVGLAKGHTDEESFFAREGPAAHHFAADCLDNDRDAWEYISDEPGKGYSFPDGDELFMSKDMADAVQVYLNFVRAFPGRNQHNHHVEVKFHCPDIHPSMFGTADDVYYDERERTLHVTDYKHGAGIVVDVKDNVQLMYYGAGMLQHLGLWGAVDTVNLTIVQPRGFHFDGPIRSWAIGVNDLDWWLYDQLVPAMYDAEESNATESGEHCRFCPVRYHACPQLLADMDELEELITMVNTAKGGAKALTNKQLGRFIQLFDLAKIVAKAANATAFIRLQDGKKIAGVKLANGRTNRTWKDDAEKAIKAELGTKAYSQPELLTPAKIDALPGGVALTARYAYKPEGKLTVVSASDARVAIEKQDNKDLFKKVGKK